MLGDGATGDTCAYACEAGYSASGDHVCGADGSFSGGACEPGSCTGSLANSPTECSAALFDSCTFECDEGYTPADYANKQRWNYDMRVYLRTLGADCTMGEDCRDDSKGPPPKPTFSSQRIDL